MEVSTLKHAGAAGIHGRSPLLRLQSDERLIALVRRGNHHAFEALVSRYESRLLAFCRHMLSSREDAEDVLQEVFAAAFNAMLADEREINVRPWLYRIARNRSLNHLRRTQAVGVDSMDIHLSEGGMTTADKVHKREEFRLLMTDVQDLPETQRTALLLREIDALSYDQIAEAMETTVPSVKSLLVRARVSLAEASEARQLSCEEVREELGEVAEGLRRTSAPVRRHLRTCERCQTFRKQLRSTNKALAALFPVGPLLLTKKLFLAHLGTTAAAGGGGAAAGAGAGVAAGGALQAGMGAVITKAAAGMAAAAIVTAGAVEVKHVAVDRPAGSATSTSVAAVPAAAPKPRAATPAPVAVKAAPQPSTARPVPTAAPEREPAAKRKAVEEKPKAAAPAKADAVPEPTPTPAAAAPAAPAVPEVLSGSDTTTLPTETAATTAPAGGALGPQSGPAPAPSGHGQGQGQGRPQQAAQPQPGPPAQSQSPRAEEAQPQPAASPSPAPAEPQAPQAPVAP